MTYIGTVHVFLSLSTCTVCMCVTYISCGVFDLCFDKCICCSHLCGGWFRHTCEHWSSFWCSIYSTRCVCVYAHCKEIIILMPCIVQSCCVVECALSPVARLYCIQRSWLEQMKHMPAIDTPQIFCKGVFVYVCTSCTTCVMF